MHYQVSATGKQSALGARRNLNNALCGGVHYVVELSRNFEQLDAKGSQPQMQMQMPMQMTSQLPQSQAQSQSQWNMYPAVQQMWPQVSSSSPMMTCFMGPPAGSLGQQLSPGRGFPLIPQAYDCGYDYGYDYGNSNGNSNCDQNDSANGIGDGDGDGDGGGALCVGNDGCYYWCNDPPIPPAGCDAGSSLGLPQGHDGYAPAVYAPSYLASHSLMQPGGGGGGEQGVFLSPEGWPYSFCGYVPIPPPMYCSRMGFHGQDPSWAHNIAPGISSEFPHRYQQHANDERGHEQQHQQQQHENVVAPGASAGASAAGSGATERPAPEADDTTSLSSSSASL